MLGYGIITIGVAAWLGHFVGSINKTAGVFVGIGGLVGGVAMMLQHFLKCNAVDLDREDFETDFARAYNGSLFQELSLKGNPLPSMATYQELKAQAEALLKQAEEVRRAELDSIITTIREQIAEYAITPEQLFGRRRAGASTARAPIAPKYRDPKSGATWSGRGKAPQWIAGAKNRNRF